MKSRFSRPTRSRLSLFGNIVGSIENKQPSDRLILRILFFTLIGSLVSSAIIYSTSLSEKTPVAGGVIEEGVIGIPRFVNPALAVTRADLDMTALLYSGLMKIDQEGNLVPDIAESVTMSDDGKTYNVIVRNNVRFQDGTPLTARDVAFTIGLIQNADLKSPLRGNWSDVKVEEIGEYELNIVLNQAYTPFIENFTLGILPKHIWSTIPIEQIPFSMYNTEPIGSGPFKIADINRDAAGIISSYKLKKFTDNESVMLSGFNVNFYPNEEKLAAAFSSKEITSSAQLPTQLVASLASSSEYKVITEPLPRVFAVFFNQNRSPALRDTAVRLALSTAIDRNVLVDTALSSFGIPINYPIPPNHPAVESVSQIADTTSTTTPQSRAESILSRAGWVKNNSGNWEKRIDGEVVVLGITLKTANTPAYEATTEVIARSWRDLGVTVEVEEFEQSDLLQAVIKPRDFESLLFGLDMNRAVDLFPFWHSSQREDPGLNISQYANIEVDRLLERARVATSSEAQNAATQSALAIIARETPATFLYVPNLAYVIKNGINVPKMKRLSRPNDRFMNVNEWNTETDTIWPIFK